MRMSYLRVVAIVLSCCILHTSCVSSTKKVQFINPNGLSKSPAYSHIGKVQKRAQLYFISGQVSQDSTGSIVGKGDLTQQTITVYENIERALKAMGANFSDVVAFKIYITDAAKIDEFRAIRNKLFNEKYYVNVKERPVSTAMAVSALFNPNWLIEIEATVAISKK
jgi:enamine deaminase RidA (YjgF/YER057c/UK114 family)